MSYLDTGIGDAKKKIIKGPGFTLHERLELQVHRCVTRWVLYPSSQGGNTWIMYPKFLSRTGYVRRHFYLGSS